MPKDDWITKIKEQRDASDAAAKRKAEARAKAERDFEARAAEFFSAVLAEVRSVVAKYNETMDEDHRVTTEVSGNMISVLWGGMAVLQIVWDHPARLVRSITRALVAGGRRDDDGPACVLQVSADGELLIDADNVEGYIRRVLEPFLRRINRLGP